MLRQRQPIPSTSITTLQPNIALRIQNCNMQSINVRAVQGNQRKLHEMHLCPLQLKRFHRKSLRNGWFALEISVACAPSFMLLPEKQCQRRLPSFCAKIPSFPFVPSSPEPLSFSMQPSRKWLKSCVWISRGAAIVAR